MSNHQSTSSVDPRQLTLPKTHHPRSWLYEPLGKNWRRTVGFRRNFSLVLLAAPTTDELCELVADVLWSAGAVYGW